MTTKFYVLTVQGGIEPDVHGPYPTEVQRDRAAHKLHSEDDPETDAVCYLDIDEDGTPRVGSWSGAFFEEDWRLQLEPGDEVTWTDPDNGACSRTMTIQTIEYFDGGSGGSEKDGISAAKITDKEGNYLEVMLSELS